MAKGRTQFALQCHLDRAGVNEASLDYHTLQIDCVKV